MMTDAEIRALVAQAKAETLEALQHGASEYRSIADLDDCAQVRSGQPARVPSRYAAGQGRTHPQWR